MVSINTKFDIDAREIAARYTSDKVMLFAASEWYRLISPYTPMDTGTLMTSAEVTPGQIRYTMPYAHRTYYRNANFRRDKHPLASREWDKAAAPVQLSKLTAALEAFIKRGNL